jgi:hypothetical protein
VRGVVAAGKSDLPPDTGRMAKAALVFAREKDNR